MKKLFIFAFTVLCTVFAAVVTSCDKEKVGDQAVATADTIRVIKGYEYEPALVHNWDSLLKTKVTDLMDSKLQIWRTEDGERLLPELYNNTVHPEAVIGSILLKQDYAIQENQLDIKPTSSTVLRDRKLEEDGSVTENDSIRFWFEDGQIWTIPVQITNKLVKIGATSIFDFPSVTLVGGEFVHLRNIPKSAKTRAEYMSADYQGEYKAMVLLKETNIESPRTLKAPIYAYTGRHMMSEDGIYKVQLTDSSRVYVDQTTDKCKAIFDLYYKSGIKVTENYEFLAKHEFKGRDPYEKTVSNFDHKWRSSDAIAWGGETTRESGDANWSVRCKRGSSGENIENGIAADKVVAAYDYYLENPIFKKTFGDTTVVVNFGYGDLRLDHMSTSITSVNSDKEGKKKAEVKDVLGTTYLGGSQTLSDMIYLYTDSKDTKEELLEGKQYVTKDSTCADMVYTKILENNDKIVVKDHWSHPWIIVNESDWTNVQEVLSQITDKEVSVTLTGSAPKTKGNWSWDELIFTLTGYVHLYDGQAVPNIRKVTFANNLKYVTSSGKTFTFDALDYKVKEIGAALNLREGNTYDYNDVIEESLGGYTRSNTAHGTLIISDETYSEYEKSKAIHYYNDHVLAEAEIVEKKGSNETVKKVSKSFPITAVCVTDFTSYEANASEKTGQPSATLSSSEKVTDLGWSCDMQNFSVRATVTLNGSTQYNGWTVEVPNGIKYTTDNGLVIDFGTAKLSVAYVNSGTTLSKTEGLNQYHSYNNTISLTYGDNSQNISAPGTIIVNEDDPVVGYEVRDKHYITTDGSVTAVGKYISIHKSGKEDVEDISKSAPRTKQVYSDWKVSDINASVLTGSASVKLLSSTRVSDGFWSWDNDKRDTTTPAQLQSSTQTNGVETTDPNRFKYDRDGKVYDWGEIDFSASSDGQSVNLISETTTESAYRYGNNVTLTYGDNAQTVTLPGTIIVAKENVIVNRTVINTEQTTSVDGVKSTITIRNEWSNGNTTEETFEKFFGGNFEKLAGWTSHEDNANQTTSAASVNTTASEQTVDGSWKCYYDTDEISTVATLNGSQQTNKWKARYPKKVVYEDVNGVKHDFGTINFSVQKTGDTVTKVSETSDKDNYDYAVNIGVLYGNTSFSSTGDGRIIVAKPWDPDFDYGKFVSCTITTARNEQHNTWVYVASVHFETGTLPIIIRKDANAPEVNKAYFENVVDSRLNSGTWIPSWGKWINTIATDTPTLMQWDTVDNYNADNMSYPTATAWGWDYGYTVGGHPSVTTDKFSASISNDGYTLTIYKGSNVFATYKAAKH